MSPLRCWGVGCSDTSAAGTSSLKVVDTLGISPHSALSSLNKHIIFALSVFSMKILLSAIVLATSINHASAHCWPCNGKGENTEDKPGKSLLRLTQLGQCVHCCNYIINNGYFTKNLEQEPFSEEAFMHRDHCKKVHCQDWQKETRASCEIREYVATVDSLQGADTLEGDTIMRPFCPSEHRCECSGESGGRGCVGGEDGWDEGPGLEYGCRNAACSKTAQDTTW